MIALDTNVVVRLLVGDDSRQAASAARLLRTEEAFLPKSVVLETAWVLRFTYNQHRDAIVAALRKLLGLPKLRVEDRTAVLAALAWHERGLDIADALHLASSSESESFATFDRKLASAARRFGCRPPVQRLRG